MHTYSHCIRVSTFHAVNAQLLQLHNRSEQVHQNLLLSFCEKKFHQANFTFNSMNEVIVHATNLHPDGPYGFIVNPNNYNNNTNNNTRDSQNAAQAQVEMMPIVDGDNKHDLIHAVSYSIPLSTQSSVTLDALSLDDCKDALSAFFYESVCSADNNKASLQSALLVSKQLNMKTVVQEVSYT